VRLLVIGAGGHAKVVIDAARAAGIRVAGIVASSTETAEILGVSVSESAQGINADCFIVAIGDNRTRARRFDECRAQGMTPVTVVHPSAILGSDVQIGPGSFLAPGVVVNTGARIGEDVILNTGCAIDHDVVVGDHSHVGPRAALCGAVSLGTGVLLGVAAAAIPQVTVGDWATVGAGAAVVEDLAGGGVYAGVPARLIAAEAE
jgi:acetyltransferase EpsM